MATKISLTTVIMYGSIKLLICTTVFFTSLLASLRKEHKLGVKHFEKNYAKVGMGLQQVQNRGRNEELKNRGKKDYKTTLLLVSNYVTDVE